MLASLKFIASSSTDGEVAILDFGEPSGLLGKLYRFYFRRVLPAIGSMLSGTKGPYAYLPASVARFPQPPEMLSRMKAAGFVRSITRRILLALLVCTGAGKVATLSFPRLAFNLRPR